MEGQGWTNTEQSRTGSSVVEKQRQHSGSLLSIFKSKNIIKITKVVLCAAESTQHVSFDLNRKICFDLCLLPGSTHRSNYLQL